MIVCLHGFAQTPGSWDRIAPDGAISLALPGHAGEPAAESFDAAVARMSACVPVGAALAGYSLGARLALAICLRHPDRVRGALLVGVSPGIASAVERAARRRWDDEMATLLEREGLERFVDRWEALAIFAGQTEAMRQAQRAGRLSHEPLALAAAMRSLGQGRMPSLWADLARSPVPLRLLTGERDAKYVAIAEQIVKCAPRATLRVVPEAGHNLLLEAPHVIREELALLRASAPPRGPT
jgi:2-succinyl-6-hydroxy-2,4-cyclohexadiene-1-carboxylate synthase